MFTPSENTSAGPEARNARPDKPLHKTHFLAIDPGDICGYAVGRAFGPVVVGQKDCRPSRSRRAIDPRRLFDLIGHVENKFGIDVILIKNPPRLPKARKARRAAMARRPGAVMFEALTQHLTEIGQRFELVNAADFKKAWCGNGNASGERMLDAGERRGFFLEYECAANALAMLHLAFGKGGIEGGNEPA